MSGDDRRALMKQARDTAPEAACWDDEWGSLALQAVPAMGEIVDEQDAEITNLRQALGDAQRVAGELRAKLEAADHQRDKAEAKAVRLQAEVDSFTHRIETTPPWPEDGKALDDEELRALMQRWSTGPERYQADMDSVIATLRRVRAERDYLSSEFKRVIGFAPGLPDRKVLLVDLMGTKLEKDSE